jgi:large subunit ribosomal protein L3
MSKCSKNRMKFILGTKQYMTQVFNDEGRVQPATVVAAGPVVVTQVKTPDKDGYRAVQFGYSPRRRRYLREERIAGEMPEITAGQTLDVSVFTPGDVVNVSSTSKGKGFQGVVKRHGFHGGPRTHGQKHAERKPGSIGSGLRTHVPKGTRMAGRLGGRRVTVKNLRVLKIDKENNQLVIAGAIPGRKGTLLEIREAKHGSQSLQSAR